ncbi:BAG domain-containing protein Samui-like isoform X1 [Euwallacea fornicatus]|uniref:BAG domain-containing protein Samui-like isoform X1 n=1 Tax=Euwallacea fornicatus TaxID=995702 RepID=UPI00338D908F
MSAVETIRDIPVIVQHRGRCDADLNPMDYDCYESSGFPFDNSGRRTRDPLEDIAQRHPEFAQHLQNFPRRSQRGAGDQDQDDFIRRRFERPFSSGRFERFGFPFDRDDFEREPQRYYEAYPEYFENFQNQRPQSPQQHQGSSSYQQHPPQYSQEYQPQSPNKQQQQQPQYQSQQSQSVSQGTQTEEECGSQAQSDAATPSQPQETKVESGQTTRGRPIQQSNTCDLAQHQPPDDSLNERGQRSMSAPPENKRFTSSVNIPMGVNQDTNIPAQGAPHSQAGSGSTERVIPIHVEGRDDPVVPRHFGAQTSAPPQQQQPQPERIFSDGPRSQPETIFGMRPEAYTQFVRRDPHRFGGDWPPHFSSGFPEDDFGFRSESPSRFAGQRQQPQQQGHRPQTVPPQQQQAPKPQTQPEAKQSEARESPKPQQPQPQPQKQPPTPMEQIEAIQKDVASLLRQVEAFNGLPKDKNYLYLDEMLTRNLLKLDNVDTQGQDSIRSARKEAIKSIERTISLLDTKAGANAAPKEDKMEVEPQEGEKMETEQSAQEPNAMEMSPAASQSEVAEKKEEETSQAKSGESDAVAKDEAEGEVEKEKVEEPTKSSEDTGNAETEVKAEVKEGEKKEKKKLKKKVNKEDKEKKQ